MHWQSTIQQLLMSIVATPKELQIVWWRTPTEYITNTIATTTPCHTGTQSSQAVQTYEIVSYLWKQKLIFWLQHTTNVNHQLLKLHHCHKLHSLMLHHHYCQHRRVQTVMIQWIHCWAAFLEEMEDLHCSSPPFLTSTAAVIHFLTSTAADTILSFFQ